MITDDQVKAEMLAEEFIETVNNVRLCLEKGQVEICISMLMEMEASMQVILALGERDDVDGKLISIH